MKNITIVAAAALLTLCGAAMAQTTAQTTAPRTAPRPGAPGAGLQLQQRNLWVRVLANLNLS